MTTTAALEVPNVKAIVREIESNADSLNSSRVKYLINQLASIKDDPEAGSAQLYIWNEYNQWSDMLLPAAFKNAPRNELIKVYCTNEELDRNPYYRMEFQHAIRRRYAYNDVLTSHETLAMITLAVHDACGIWLKELYDRGLIVECYLVKLFLKLYDRFNNIDPTSKIMFKQLDNTVIKKFHDKSFVRYLTDYDLHKIVTLQDLDKLS